MGILGDAGLQAGIAGRGLRGVFAKLGSPTGKAKDKLEELNIELFNAAGEFIGLPETVGQFEKALSGMTDEQRAAALGAVFSRQELAAFSVLLRAGEGDLQSYSDELGNSLGIASEIAAKQLDNLSGDVTLFKSALSGIKIDIFTALEPVLRQLVQSGIQLLSTFGPQLTDVFNAITATIRDAAGSLSGFFGAFQRGGMDALLESLGISVEAFRNFQAVLLTVFQVVKSVFAGIIAALQPAMTSLQDGFSTLTETLNSMGITWGDVWSTIGIVVGGVIVTIISIVVGLVNAIASGFARAMVTIQQLIDIWQDLQAAWETGDILGVVQAIFDGIVTIFVGSYEALIAFTQGFIEGIANFWQALFDTLVGGSIIPDLVNGIISWFEMLIEPVLGVFETLAGGISTVLGAIFGAIAGGGDDGISIDFSGLVTTLTVTIPESLAVLTEQFTLLFSTVSEQLTMLTTEPLALFIQDFSSIYILHIPLLLETWISMTEQIVAQINITIASLNDLIAVIFEAKAAAIELADAIVQGMKDAAEAFEDAADSLKEDLIPAIKDTITEFENLKTAAEDAAKAARSVGEASSEQTGVPPFQHGTSSSGFVIPPGFPNDSFLARFTSGERIFVDRKGMTNSNNRETVNNYYFNQTVNTRAEQSTVIGDFRTMQLLLGT
jgi:hypothetical protein